MFSSILLRLMNSVLSLPRRLLKREAEISLPVLSLIVSGPVEDSRLLA